MPINPVSNFPPIGSAPPAADTPIVLKVGVEYLGKILTLDNSGNAEVQIGNQVFGMSLPNKNAVGEVLHFRYLGSDPNPTFLLLNVGANAQLPENVILSGTSMLITQFLDEAQLQASLPMVAVQTEPVMQNPLFTELTALQLQNAILLSGLFYESHIANFTKGQWHLSSLLKEPQNRPNFNAAQVVAKQLEALENQMIRWSGTIWPGQLMDWQLGYEEQDARSENGEDVNPKNIVSEIALDLPNLGKVRIHLRMAGDVLSVFLKAEKPHTETLLMHQAPALKTTLNSQGQTVDTLAVVPHG